jgi:hypothetical protein
MMNFLTINDETANGRVLNQILLTFQKNEITVRQLIKKRSIEEKRDDQVSFRAFRERGFHIRINNQQVKNLDEQILIDNKTRVSFVELR